MTPEPVWQRIAKIEFFLCFLPPLGLWMLYRDKVLSRSAKVRILFITFVLPVIALFAVSMWQMHQMQKVLNAMGV